MFSVRRFGNGSGFSGCAAGWLGRFWGIGARWLGASVQSASAQVLTNLLWQKGQRQAGCPPNKASRLTLARILGRLTSWLR